MELMHITFNNTHYHLNGEMEQWCRTYVGEGRWVGGKLETWEGMGNYVWAIESMFGHTTFMFKESKYYHWFLLRWGS
jgi:hypothetical protein